MMQYFNRFFKEPKRSYFLFGPRGTGKTMLMEHLHKTSLIINLRDPEQERSLLSSPERLTHLVHGAKKEWIVIDEIQKVPSLLDVVHTLIEEKTGVKFVLTGSSSRKLKRMGADLLGGRASNRHLHPFMAAELGEEFNLEKALDIGLLPLVWADQDPLDALQAYINLYLKEEIQAEGLVRNIGDFTRFLEVMSFSHGATLNLTNIAQECHVKRKTLEGYMQVLSDLLLAYELPVFAHRAKRELAVRPKFYFFDAGIYRSLRRKGPLDKSHEIDGGTLEGLVGQHLRAWCDYSDEPHELSFWQTRSHVEVDFVVYGPLGLWAIEVKNGKNPSTKDLKSLKTFKQDYPEAKCLFIYRGDWSLEIDGIACIPAKEFLKGIKPNIPLS
jgi:uncharacterized protein